MARVKSQKSQKRRKTFVRFLPIYILMLPGLIYLFINNYMPLPGLVIAFKQYNAGKGIYGSPWVGLKTLNICLRQAMPLLLHEIPFSTMWHLS